MAALRRPEDGSGEEEQWRATYAPQLSDHPAPADPRLASAGAGKGPLQKATARITSRPSVQRPLQPFVQLGKKVPTTQAQAQARPRAVSLAPPQGQSSRGGSGTGGEWYRNLPEPADVPKPWHECTLPPFGTAKSQLCPYGCTGAFKFRSFDDAMVHLRHCSTFKDMKEPRYIFLKNGDDVVAVAAKGSKGPHIHARVHRVQIGGQGGFVPRPKKYGQSDQGESSSDKESDSDVDVGEVQSPVVPQAGAAKRRRRGSGASMSPQWAAGPPAAAAAAAAAVPTVDEIRSLMFIEACLPNFRAFRAAQQST